jgi:hypothetical protein
MLCALLTLSVGLAFADANHPDKNGVCHDSDPDHPGKSIVVPCNIKNNLETGPGKTTTDPRVAQSTAVNSSRSNIKNNLNIVSGATGEVRCTSSASGKTAVCTESEVALLNKELARSRPTKVSTGDVGVESVALAKDGVLMCATSSRTGPCTAAHIADLNTAAAAMRGINDPIGGVGVPLDKNKPK